MKTAFVVLLISVVTFPATAQWLDRPWPDIPRTANGEPDLSAPAPRGADGKPDFTGIWNGPPPVARLDPDNLQPWVAELALQRQQEFYKERPLFRCLPNGPETESSAGWKRFFQTPAAIVILNENLTYRLIHMDGRELETNPVPSWTGYSVGHWEGDTLVVDSNGFNDQTWVSRFGVSHTEALHVNERFTRTDFGHMQVEVTFTDPEAFAVPWGFDMQMNLTPDTEMLESVCERGSDDWSGSFAVTEANRVSVSPDILAQYVGVYSGNYGGGVRTYEVTLVDGELIATIVSAYTALGLGAAGLEEGVPRALVPLSETLFDGLGLGYRFVINDSGEVDSLIITHVSGDYNYARQP